MQGKGSKGAVSRGGKENLIQVKDERNSIGLDGNFGSRSTAPLPERLPIPRQEVKLPLEPRTLVNAKWRDDKFHPARVVERRPMPDGTPDEWE